MTSDRKNIPPAKLLYKGSEYHLAITEAGSIWKNQAAPRLERMLEIAKDDERSDHVKKEQVSSLYAELKEYLRLLGIR